MAKPRLRRIALPAIALTLCVACVPRRDLDATAAGNGTSARGGGGANAGVRAETAQGAAAQTGGTASEHAGGAGGRSTDETVPAILGGRDGSGGAVAAGGFSPGSGGGGTTAAGGLSRSSGGAGTTASGSAVPAGGVSTVTGTTTTSTGGTLASTGGASSNSGGTSSATGGVSATGGTSTSTIAPNLGELIDPPVQGTISYSATASWDIYGKQQEAFRIETPTATYFVVKSVAAIASLVDKSGVMWLNFSWDFLSNRGIPNLGGCCQLVPPSGVSQPVMTTVLDAPSVTATHIRLVSKPVDGDYYWLVWDFFVTHMTLTINRAQAPFGFTYDGVPGNALDGDDQLVLSTGEARKANSPYSGDLPGPVEWAYITNVESGLNGSLFLIQHGDDNLPESYTITDKDGTKGTKFVFGSGHLEKTPVRFSLGLVNSVAHAAVSERVAFIVKNIQ